MRQFSSRQKDWLERASAVSREVLAPNARKVDAEGIFPRESLDAIRKAGLWNVGVPEDCGGLGLDPLGVALVCEQLARGCGSTAMCFGMHVNSFWPWGVLANKQQKENYIAPALAAGKLATHANTERATGTQFWNWTSAATRTSNGWRLNAEKAFVTSAGEADLFWFTSRMSPDAPLGAANLWFLEASRGGSITDEWKGMGLRGQRSSRMLFKDVDVPEDTAIVADGSTLDKGFEPILVSVVATLVANFLGMAQALVDHTRQHVKTRIHQNTGKRLSQNDMVQERIGRMQMQVNQSRELLHSALDLASRAGLDQSMVPLLQTKASVAEVTTYVANEALHACGAVAYRGDNEVSRVYRDAVVAPVMAPSQDWCNIFVGRALLEEPLFGE